MNTSLNSLAGNRHRQVAYGFREFPSRRDIGGELLCGIMFEKKVKEK
jgi:hypothetical protein